MHEAFAAQISAKVEDVIPQSLNFSVLRLGDGVDQNMQLAAVLREIGCHFLAEEHVRQMGDLRPPSMTLWSVMVT